MEAEAMTDLDGTVLRMLDIKRAGLRAVARWLRVDLPADTESGRLAAIRARSVAPASCGPEIPVAPARGRLVAVQPVEMRRVADGYEPQHVGWAGRDAARASDVWDRMADQARRAGGHDPFTRVQKGVARDYAALVERHSAVGLKGRSIETMMGGRGGGGAGRDVMDLILDEGRRIAAMEQAAGPVMALVVQRQGKGQRAGIPVLVLVRSVCLDGMTVSEVLRRHGWSTYGDVRAMAQQALADALDRMALCGRTY